MALTIVQPGKGIFLSEDLCSRDNVWPPTLITGTRLCRTSPNDTQRLDSEARTLSRFPDLLCGLPARSPADSPQCRVLLGSVSLFFSYPQREGNLIPSHAPNLTKHGRKKAVKLKFKPLSFCYHRQCQGPRHGFEDVSKHVKVHHGGSRHRASTMQKYACRVADNIARYL